MTALDSVLAKFPNRRRMARGWLARCPAHDDRSPSLSIGVGRNGSVLFRCFAGCAVADIVGAIGLSIRDLFASRDAIERQDEDEVKRRSAYKRAPRATVEAFLDREIQRRRTLRIERLPLDTPAFRSADVNAARYRASNIFGIKLAPIQRFAWEGFEPHDRDPAFPDLFARARVEVSWLDPSALPTAASAEDSLRIAAGELAAGWLHAMGREMIPLPEWMA